MIFLRALRQIGNQHDYAAYPMSIPLFRNLSRLSFTSPITILAGENGTGKTTLLEILALKLNAVRIDGSTASAYNSPKLSRIKSVESFFRLEMTRKPKRNFFFQAEDFIRYIDELNDMKQEARQALTHISEEYANRSDYAKSLASMPYHRTLYEIESMYEGDISKQSHGESFITFFGSRIIEGGLYLLDEPESALSPFNQLVVLNLMAEAEKKGCQLIISTHSPILTAYPRACIYEIRDNTIQKTEYEQMESIRLLQSFLNSKEYYLRDI